MMRLRRRRNAVAEIVGTLLILVATVAIAGTMVAIATSSIQIGILNQQNQATLYTQQLQERFIVYDVYFHTVSGTSYMQLEVYNYGLVNVNLVTLYTNLTGTEAQLASFATSYPNGVNLSPGQTGNLTVALNFVRGGHYDIILVSSAGTKSESLWAA